MYNIIVNADDFGLNELITRTTLEMIERGTVSSATIMANGDCLDLVKEIAISHPEISYGIHLCLDEFRSLTSNPIFEKYGITNSCGVFVLNKIKELKVIPSELRQAIITELEKQIETVLVLGIPLSHIDSHHHWHMNPLLLPIFKEVVTKYGFSRFRLIRAHLNFISIRKFLGSLRKIIFRDLSCRLKFKTVTYFYSYEQFYNMLLNKKRIPKNGIIELMVHPGNKCLTSFAMEDDLMRVDALKKYIQYKLISYNEI